MQFKGKARTRVGMLYAVESDSWCERIGRVIGGMEEEGRQGTQKEVVTAYLVDILFSSY
jgi:hypothetical protein